MAGCNAHSTMGVAKKVTNGNHPNLKSGPWGALIHILIHLVVGALIFVAIALVAVALGEFVKRVEAWGASPFVVFVLTAVEYILLLADAFLFLYLVIKSIVKVGKEIELRVPSYLESGERSV